MDTTPRPVDFGADPDQLRRLFELMQRVGYERAFAALQQADPVRTERITVGSYYEGTLRPEWERQQSKDSIRTDRRAIRKWAALTGDPDIRDVGVLHLENLRDGMLGEGLAPATINCVWREVRAILQAAFDDGVIPSVPKIARRSSIRLVPQPPKVMREPVTQDEINRLWRECRNATYPSSTRVPAPKLWRVALCLFWTYGMRTSDLLSLEWDNVQWSNRRILFAAHKTSKLQGLPMTDVVIEQLRSLKAMSPAGWCPKVFVGFNRRGSQLQRRRKGKRLVQRPAVSWKRGFYTTWRHEIQEPAGISPEITFKHLRESMVQRYNEVEPGLGAWIAGHFVPGVTAQHYDNPTARIRRAIEAADVPDCFREFD